MTKRKTPPCWLCSTSTLPVDSQKAVKSGTEPGSVASTSSLAPFGSSDSAFLVFRIGRGQARPLVSSVLSGIAGLRTVGGAAYINEPKELAMDLGQDLAAQPSSCAGQAGRPRCRFEASVMIEKSGH